MNFSRDEIELLSAYADGELRGARLRRAEHLLAESNEAQAFVEQHRSFRSFAKVTLLSDSMPIDLPRRLAARLPRRRAMQRSAGGAAALILLGAGLAAAAAVTAVYTGVLPLAGVATQQPALRLSATVFAGLHNDRSLAAPRPSVMASPAEMGTKLAKSLSYRFHLPDLSGEGYQLLSVAQCQPAPGVQGLIARYGSTSEKGSSLSVFSLDQPVVLDEARADVSCRAYEEALVGSTRVIKWTEVNSSYIVCSTLETEQLRSISGSVRLSDVYERGRVGLAGRVQR